ncbi:MAG: glycosyltransferase family 2 protein [Spirochaetes bacterium]|nr:glycosyltransferase family 2 protein [Spirochaetota bacterium]
MELIASIVVYRSFSEVLPAIESLKRSMRGISGRIVIIDNSDGDEYYRRFTAHFAKDKSVSVIKSPRNGGYGAGNNLALEHKAKYHLVMNPDVIVGKDTIRSCIVYMDKHADVVLATPRITDERGVTQYLCRRFPSLFDLILRRMPSVIRARFAARLGRYEMRDMPYDKSMDIDWASGAFLFMRQDAFRANPFDERYFMYFEDTDLCRQLHTQGRIVYVPETSVVHAWGKGSHGNAGLFKAHVVSMIHYFNKWGWKLW